MHTDDDTNTTRQLSSTSQPVLINSAEIRRTNLGETKSHKVGLKSTDMDKGNSSIMQSDKGDSDMMCPEIDNKALTLKREMGLPSTIALALGRIIGAGIFIMPKGAAIGGGSVGLTLLMWLFAGLIQLARSLVYIELGVVLPKSGGDYNFLKVAYGKWMAFMEAYCRLAVSSPSGHAILGLTFSQYVLSMYFNDGCGPVPDYLYKMMAVVIISLLGVVNCYSVTAVARLQVLTTIFKVSSLLLIIGGGVYNISSGRVGTFKNLFANSESDPSAIVLGLYSCSFAYGGWDTVLEVAEEVKNPRRNFPLSIITVLLLIILLYLRANISYFSVMSVEQLVASPAVGFTWAEQTIPFATWILPLCVAISVFGNLSASLLGSSRLHFAMARDNIWPEFLSMIHIRRYTPFPSVLMTVFISIIYVMIGSIGDLIAYMAFISQIFSSMMLSCAIILRYKMPDAPRPFRVPFIVPVLLILINLSMMVLPVINKPKIEFLYGTLVSMVALPIYGIIHRFRHRSFFVGRFTCWLQLLFQVGPPSKTVDEE